MPTGGKEQDRIDPIRTFTDGRQWGVRRIDRDWYIVGRRPGELWHIVNGPFDNRKSAATWAKGQR